MRACCLCIVELVSILNCMDEDLVSDVRVCCFNTFNLVKEEKMLCEHQGCTVGIVVHVFVHSNGMLCNWSSSVCIDL